MRKLVVLVVVALVCTVGCTTPRPRRPVAPPADLATTGQPTSRPQTAGFSLDPVADFTLGDRDVGPLAVDGHHVIYPFSGGGSADWDQVGLLDLATRSARRVAASEWSAGLVNWVAGAGDWVAWVDQQRRQSDGDASVLWRVWTYNTTTHERVLLASNGRVPDPFVPRLLGGDGYLFWSQAEPDRSARELVWKAPWSHAHSLLRHADLTPGSETVADGRMVYLGRAAGHSHPHARGGDCWSVPLDGTRKPHPLTRTALAMGCAAHAGRLVWTEHIDPRQRPLPPDGVLDDPYRVLTKPVAGGPPQVLHRGYLPMGYPVVGQGFVVWQSPVTGVVVRSLSSAAHLRLPRGADGISPAAGDGPLLAYTSRRAGVTVIHTARVGARR